MTVGGAEALGQSDRFVDDHAIRHVGRRLELMRTHPQHRALDRIELGGLAVHPRCQRHVQRFAAAADVGDQLVEIAAIGLAHVFFGGEFVEHVLPGRGVDLPAIQRLHGELARHGAARRGRIDAGAASHQRRPLLIVCAVRLAGRFVARALLALNGRQQFDHLERGLHGFSALVHARERGTLLGLRLVLGGEHAEDHRHTGREARVHEAARALARHVIEMRRVAADHAAQRDHRVVLAAGGELERRQRQLEGAGRAHARRVHRRLPPCAGPGARGALDELVDQRGIEARRDDGHAVAAGIEAALAGSWYPVMGAEVYRAPLFGHGSFGHVTRDLESKGRDALQLLGGGQHLHARHAEILEDLRADAVGAQHLRRHLALGRHVRRAGPARSPHPPARAAWCDRAAR